MPNERYYIIAKSVDSSREQPLQLATQVFYRDRAQAEKTMQALFIKSKGEQRCFILMEVREVCEMKLNIEINTNEPKVAP